MTEALKPTVSTGEYETEFISLTNVMSMKTGICKFGNMCMVAKFLRLAILICNLTGTQGMVCEEEAMMEALWQEKPEHKIEMESIGGITWTPRSLLQNMRNCSVYHGNIKIKELSAMNHGFEEYVRLEDLENLRNLREIHGIVYLDLLKYPEIKSLTFFSSLRAIHSSVAEKGFTLIRSQVEMIGFRDIRLGVVFIGIGYNDHLCYMENFRSVNRSSTFILTKNKDPSICTREGKVCSRSCNPKKGCWGPRDLHCIECRYWRAGNLCVDSCETRRNFFTPLTGRVCGRCHQKCGHGCFGPRSDQCYRRAETNDHCLKHMYFNDTTRRCEECSRSCFGAGYENRTQLTVPACSGPGPEGCSFRCRGMTFITVSEGFLECHSCHPSCRSGCLNASLPSCIQNSDNESRGTQIFPVGLIVGAVLALVTAVVNFIASPSSRWIPVGMIVGGLGLMIVAVAPWMILSVLLKVQQRRSRSHHSSSVDTEEVQLLSQEERNTSNSPAPGGQFNDTLKKTAMSGP